MRRIFISYARRNGERVQSLVLTLEQAGISVWLDNKDIPVSVSWYEEAMSAIELADIVVECRSPAWHESTACALEHRHAGQAGKQLVAVEIESESFRSAMERILTAVRGCSAAMDTHTAVLVRSRHWHAVGRPAGLLISAESLRRARDLVALGRPPLDPVARDFVAKSRIRQRKKRRWIAFGVVVSLLAAMTYGTSLVAGYAIDVTIAKNTEGFSMLSSEPDSDVFGQMARTAERVRARGPAFSHRLQLVEALSVTTPARSYLVGGGAAIRLAESDDDVPVTVPGDEGPCCSPLTLDDGRQIIVAESGALLAATGVVWQPANASSGPVTSMASSVDLVAVAHAADGVVKLLSRADLSNRGGLVVSGEPGALAFSRSGRYLAVGEGPDVVVFDTRTSRKMNTLRGSIGDVRQLFWSPQDDEVWAVAGANRVSTWRWKRGKVLVDDPSTWFVAVAGPLADARFVAVSRDGRVHVVAADLGLQRVLPTSAREVVMAAASPNSPIIALGTQNSVVFYDLSTQTERVSNLGACTPVGLAYSADGKLIHVGCRNSKAVHNLNPATGSLVATAEIEFGTGASVVATAGGAVRVGTTEGAIIEFDRELKTRSQLLGSSCGMPIRAMSQTADGSAVVFIGDGAGVLGCMLNGRFDGQWSWEHHVVRGHTSRLGRAIGLRADGRFAAAGLSDGTVAFWSPDGELPSGTYHDFGGEVRGLQFTQDGRDIVVATNDGLIEVMPVCQLCVSTQELAGMAERRVDEARRMGLTG